MLALFLPRFRGITRARTGGAGSFCSTCRRSGCSPALTERVLSARSVTIASRLNRQAPPGSCRKCRPGLSFPSSTQRRTVREETSSALAKCFLDSQICPAPGSVSSVHASESMCSFSAESTSAANHVRDEGRESHRGFRAVLRASRTTRGTHRQQFHARRSVRWGRGVSCLVLI